MPWKESTAVSERLEFVTLAMKEGTNVRALCRRFGISSRTGYKWIGRHRQGEAGALEDGPRRPQRSSRRSQAGTEASVLEVREEHPAWGGRKIRGRLIALGVESVPAASTVTTILHRHGKIDPAESEKNAAWTRFEHAAPNELWQMDFKGHVEAKAGRCHPLTVLDDHSRYCLGLRACGKDLPGFQQAFDRWREANNHERSHEALGMAVPSARYRASVREMPKSLPPIEYGP